MVVWVLWRRCHLVVVATTDEDSPEALESRRTAAGVHLWSITATRTIVHPNGSVEFNGDTPGGPPSIWG